LLLPCKAVVVLLGGSIEASLPSEQQTYDTILAHLSKLPVSVTAHLASASLSVEEALHIESGDIVCFETNINQPIDLTINDKCLFRGKLAQSDEHYAVVISETAQQ
jgi:flagellar motor switch protein FliM